VNTPEEAELKEYMPMVKVKERCTLGYSESIQPSSQAPKWSYQKQM